MPTRPRRLVVATALATLVALLVPAHATSSAAVGSSAPDRVHLTGQVMVVAGENGEEDAHLLRLGSGHTVPLADAPDVVPGSTIRATAELPGTDGGDVLRGPARTEALARATEGPGWVLQDDYLVQMAPTVAAPSAHRTYVAVLQGHGSYNFSNVAFLDEVTRAQNYWVRESAGAITAWTVSPDLVPVHIPAATSAGNCGLSSAEFAPVVETAAATAFPGVDFSAAGNHLVVLVPPACLTSSSASGRGTLGSGVNSGGFIVQGDLGAGRTGDVLEHEFGHNLSLEHANNKVAEYGNLYETMGAGPGGSNPTLGSVYRAHLDVLVPGEVADGSAGGTWRLVGRGATSGLRGISFIDPDTGLVNYVDFRNSLGEPGAWYVTNPNTLVHTYNQYYRAGVVVSSTRGHAGALLRDDNGAVEPDRGALVVGQTWTNPGGSVQVTFNSTDLMTAEVSLTRQARPALPAGSVTISGRAEPYYRVSATAAVTGADNVVYRWFLDGQPVPGVTGREFFPTLAMAGRTLTVEATGYALGRDPSPVARASVTIGGAAWFIRGDRSPLVIEGGRTVGSSLRVTGRDWVNAFGQKPAGYAPTYRWYRNSSPIPGATSATYTIQNADRGAWIQVTEHPRAPGHETSALISSDAFGPVETGGGANGLRTLTSARPRIRGKAVVGRWLTARTPGWTNGTSFRYRWKVGKKVVKRGRTARRLKVTRAMRGKRIQLLVTGSKAGYSSQTEKSRFKRVRARR